MNKEILEELKLNPRKVRQKGKVKILEEQYAVKKIKHSNRKIYDYLTARNFLNFPSFVLEKDGYEVVEYVDDIDVSLDQKQEDMIYLLTVLHNKTTFYKELDMDDVKKMYEEVVDQLRYLLEYYHSIHLMVEEEVYMSPSNYYFILHVSSIYRVISHGLLYIEEWYKSIHDRKTIRFVLNHNQLKKEHLLENQNLYFISWDEADFGFPTNDIEVLFRENYETLELEHLFSSYNSKYKLYSEEYDYCLARLSILKRVDFKKDEQEKMRDVIELIRYTLKLDDFFLKQDSNKTKYQKQ